MTKKKTDYEEDAILTSVEARRKYKAETPDEPDHPEGRESAVIVAKAAAAAALPPVETPKGK